LQRPELLLLPLLLLLLLLLVVVVVVTVQVLLMLLAALTLKQRLSYLTCTQNGRSGGACSSQMARSSPSTT
jgi:hypothetical protein